MRSCATQWSENFNGCFATALSKRSRRETELACQVGLKLYVCSVHVMRLGYRNTLYFPRAVIHHLRSASHLRKHTNNCLNLKISTYRTVAYGENFHGGGWFRVIWWSFVFGVLFVRSQFDALSMFPNQRFGEVY